MTWIVYLLYDLINVIITDNRKKNTITSEILLTFAQLA